MRIDTFRTRQRRRQKNRFKLSIRQRLIISRVVVMEKCVPDNYQFTMFTTVKWEFFVIIIFTFMINCCLHSITIWPTALLLPAFIPMVTSTSCWLETSICNYAILVTLAWAYRCMCASNSHVSDLRSTLAPHLNDRSIDNMRCAFYAHSPYRALLRMLIANTCVRQTSAARTWSAFWTWISLAHCLWMAHQRQTYVYEYFVVRRADLIIN